MTGTVAQAAHGVLVAAEPRGKVKAARAAARAWRAGRLVPAFDVTMPVRPARPALPELLAPSRMPKRGKAGSLASRIALLHALAHIEFSAIDLAFDLIGRFGAGFPHGFLDDWFHVGAEEAMHFALLDRRLRALGSRYGALPAHDGLWEAAEATANDAAARLAVVPLVLEARGLDVTPQTVARLRAAGDERSARILDRIAADEERHVGAGMRWFLFHAGTRERDAATLWRDMVRRHFRGAIKPPFNASARERAGLTPDWYTALAQCGAPQH